MTCTSRTAAALAILAFAATVALAQNADRNSAGPTKNDYRLKVIEPAEGSTITGPTVRVVVNTAIREQIDGERKDVNSMPRPSVDVFLDGTLQGTMKDTQNVITIENVSNGPHKLALLAKNRANEIIDRKEIRFSSSGTEVLGASSSGTTPADDVAPLSTGTDGGSSAAHASAATMDDSSLAGPTSPAPISSYVPPPPPPPQPVTTVASAESPRRPSRLPDTASNQGALLLAGAAFLGSALVIHRRRA